MTALRIVQNAISAAKKIIMENLDSATEQVGTVNPYGEKTLLLDMKAENEILSILKSSGIDFAILTEEQGWLMDTKKPEYLAIVDPIDGSANLARGIPLVSIGISIVPFRERMTSDDIQVSVIDSVFTDETYIAICGNGVTRNGRRVKVRNPITLKSAIISYNTKIDWNHESVNSSLNTIREVHDTRRTASPLFDLCWIAAGFLDGMVDLRNMLPIVHLCGIHMVIEAGGNVVDENGSRFNIPLESGIMMNFVAASNETLARQILTNFKN